MSSVLDSLLLARGNPRNSQAPSSCFTFNTEGILAPLTSLANAGRRSLTRSNSFSGFVSSKPKTRQTIHSASSPVNLSEALQRRTKRSHTDPGRSVQLVFHGPYGGEQKTTPAPPRRPSLVMDMGFALPSVPAVPDEKESPRMSRDTTMTPNTASNSLDSSKGDTREVSSRAVRFRQTITEVEVTTPYGIVYDGIKPMCFDFDRWGRKIYHFFPNEDDPGMEQAGGMGIQRRN
eukprot:s4378_g1.t2